LQIALIGKIGDRLGSGKLSCLFAHFVVEVLLNPSFSSLVVQDELVHVVADVPQQVFRLCKPWFLLEHHLRRGKKVIVLLVIENNWTAVFRKLLLRVVARIHFYEKFSVEGALADKGTIEVGFIA
jgi:hypothetical protein